MIAVLTYSNSHNRIIVQNLFSHMELHGSLIRDARVYQRKVTQAQISFMKMLISHDLHIMFPYADDTGNPASDSITDGHHAGSAMLV